MTYPAWMMKGEGMFDSRNDLLSYLFEGPRMALLERIAGKTEENKGSNNFF